MDDIRMMELYVHGGFSSRKKLWKRSKTKPIVLFLVYSHRAQFIEKGTLWKGWVYLLQPYTLPSPLSSCCWETVRRLRCSQAGDSGVYTPEYPDSREQKSLAFIFPHLLSLGVILWIPVRRLAGDRPKSLEVSGLARSGRRLRSSRPETPVLVAQQRLVFPTHYIYPSSTLERVPRPEISYPPLLQAPNC